MGAAGWRPPGGWPALAAAPACAATRAAASKNADTGSRPLRANRTIAMIAPKPSNPSRSVKMDTPLPEVNGIGIRPTDDDAVMSNRACSRLTPT